MSDGAQDSGVVDPVAFTALVDREGPDVYAYLARRASVEAEDLLGRVWGEAYASRCSFDPARGSARSWLFGVARHVLLRHWRDRRPELGDLMLTTLPVDPWDEVDARLDSAALAGQLRAALRGLPEVDRVVREATEGRELYAAILNAGVTHFGDYHELSWEGFQSMLATV